MPFNIRITSFNDPDHTVEYTLPKYGVRVCRQFYENTKSDARTTLRPILKLSGKDLSQARLDKLRMGIEYIPTTVRDYPDTITINDESVSREQCLFKLVTTKKQKFGLFKPKTLEETVLEVINLSESGTIMNKEEVKNNDPIRIEEHPISCTLEFGKTFIYFDEKNRKRIGYSYTITITEK